MGTRCQLPLYDLLHELSVLSARDFPSQQSWMVILYEKPR
jgi:hypothetical protein